MSDSSPYSPIPEPTAVAVTHSPAVGSLLSPAFARLLGAQFAVNAAFAVYFLLPKYLAVELGADASRIGSVNASSLAAAVLATPFVGRALDRMGRKPVFLFGAGLTTLASTAFFAVPNLGSWIYLVRGLHGLGFTCTHNALAALVADTSPPRRFGQAMGLLGVASLAASAVVPGIAEPLAHAYGWSWVFLFATVASAAGGLCALSIVEAPRKENGEPRTRLLAIPRSLLWAGAAMGAAFGTMFTFVQPYALELGAERVASFFVGFTLAALLPRLFLGSLPDRFGRRRFAVGSMALYGVVTLATARLNPDWLVLYGLGQGLAHGLLYPTLAALVAEAAGADGYGRALTYYAGAFNLGAGISMFVGGALASATSYALVFAAVGSLTILIAVVLSATLKSSARHATPKL